MSGLINNKASTTKIFIFMFDFLKRYQDSFPAFRETVSTSFPAGHFYSPVVSPKDLPVASLWPENTPEILGINFNNLFHEEVLNQDFPNFMPDFDYPEKQGDIKSDGDFFIQNSQFSWLDARLLFVLLRKWMPSSIIEVGSGFSSLLMADINNRFLNSSCEITCIEPYPRFFLKEGIVGISSLIEQKVQEVPLRFFDSLNEGDILFIDSSHVSKTGSDVNFLYFEVLPRLKKGVRIHVHDIFLPFEYPKEWVIAENRSWNEQYIVRALLMYSTAFRVLFGSSYAFHLKRDAVIKALTNFTRGHAFGGGSLWIERS